MINRLNWIAISVNVMPTTTNFFLYSHSSIAEPLDIAPYKWFIEGVVDSARYISDESIDNESDACFTFDCPEALEEEQKKYVFIWSEDEIPLKSSKKIRRHYPHAQYWSPGKLGHCGFIFRKPEEYAAYLGSIAGSN